MTSAGRVAGKVSIVTGGAAGLGEADTRRLASEGARVVITDIDEERGARLAADLPGSLFLPHDVRSEADWRSVIDRVMQDFGRLDVLVNNAGVVRFATVEDCTPEEFRFVNAVMTEGTFLGCRAAIPAMAAGGGGSIVNMASVVAVRGNANVFAYAAAKGAILAMTRSIVVHCQDKGYPVRANVILPGAHDTAMTKAAFATIDDRMTEAARRMQGAPSDVADLVLYLASDESKTVNGAEIVIDNGRIVR